MSSISERDRFLKEDGLLNVPLGEKLHPTPSSTRLRTGGNKWKNDLSPGTRQIAQPIALLRSSSVEKRELKLELPPANGVRLVPVNLGEPDSSVKKANSRYSFPFAPAPPTILLL